MFSGTHTMTVLINFYEIKWSLTRNTVSTCNAGDLFAFQKTKVRYQNRSIMKQMAYQGINSTVDTCTRNDYTTTKSIFFSMG
jgi:hypothetical protein